MCISRDIFICRFHHSPYRYRVPTSLLWSGRRSWLSSSRTYYITIFQAIGKCADLFWVYLLHCAAGCSTPSGTTLNQLQTRMWVWLIAILVCKSLIYVFLSVPVCKGMRISCTPRHNKKFGILRFDIREITAHYPWPAFILPFRKSFLIGICILFEIWSPSFFCLKLFNLF